MKKLLLYQFDLHHRLFNNVLEGFTDDETNRRVEGNRQMNHVKYLSGHILNSQYGLAVLSGLEPEIKWNDLFAVMGRSKARDDIAYPTIETIIAEWNNIYPTVRGELEALRLEALAKSPPAPFDRVGETIGNVWAFINHHIAYHIGQIGILRRGFGKKPMRYD